MKTSTVQAGSREHYFVPEPSLYPVILSGGMFLLALGFIQAINNFPLGKWVMLGGFGVILYVLFGWFGRSSANHRADPTATGRTAPSATA
jgi:cytochrome c oxidase subunit 3